MKKIAYIGRPSRWGNPLKRFLPCPVCSGIHEEKGSTLKCYRIYLWGRINEDERAIKIAQDAGLQTHSWVTFKEQLQSIIGYKLLCPGCALNDPTCHARVLEKALKWLSKNPNAIPKDF